MTFGFVLLTVGTILVMSGVKNVPIAKVLKGEIGEGEPGPTESAFTGFLAGGEGGTGGEGGEALSGGAGAFKGKGGSAVNWAAQVPGHPELKPGISAVAATVLHKFPGLVITATTNGTHVNGSYHYKGRAVDLGGSTAEMNKAAKWCEQFLTPVLVEGIHNPGLSVKNHAPVPSSFWGAETWAAHANHIHLAV